MRKIVTPVLKWALWLLATVLLIVTLLSLWPLPAPLTQKAVHPDVYIINANIVDAEQGTILPNKTIWIKGDRIYQILDTTQYSGVSGVTVIDANNRFIIPGLWDMHNHFAFQTAPQMSMPIYIANGVMNVRDMQGVVNINEERENWRKSIIDGQLLGPRIIAYADEMLGGNYDEQDINEVVRRSAQNPNTFIKIYSGILPERFFKFARLATEHRVPFAGHYPNAIDPVEVSKAGQRSFEHGLLFINGASDKSQALRDHYYDYYTSDDYSPRAIEDYESVLQGFNMQMFQNLVDVMAEQGTYFVPTHITRRYEAMVYDDHFINDPRRSLVPPMVDWVWQGDVSGELNWYAQRGQNYKIAVYEKGLELTGLAHQAGLKVMVGGDTLDPYSFPGSNVHDEMEQLVKAGLTPAEAITAATRTPAEYFSLQDEYGAIQESKIADLVILNENPLTDIQHTRQIEGVVFAGRYYSKTDLSQFQAYVQNNNSGVNGIIMSLKMFWRMLQDNRH
ncbi:MAG: amidohydrolase family protein [Aestuariibacter sp.]